MTPWTKDGALNIPLVRDEWQRALNRSRINTSGADAATVAAGEEWHKVEKLTFNILDNSYIRYVPWCQNVCSHLQSMPKNLNGSGPRHVR